ncbi:DUF4194 domain-containing protein [uncultured Adlercreutzia sp.]|uniref:DUF4194 domain-containing protein n=1 Tax=uncultured Adlercreutzia sp. TaxID=875803 RepID=UPI0026F37E54|nr:DUF4194 domain-containing protein [uncultured Adlercreutzia sp.]
MTEFYDNTAGADDRGLWPGDCGTLSLDARRAFLQLLRGPMLTERRHSELWAALVTNREAVEIALANLFLVLVLSEEDGIAFVRDAPAEDERIPAAVRKSKLTFCDTIMVLTLRKTLMLEGDGRAFVSKREVFDQLASYRAATSHDEAAFQKKLDASWSKMTKNNILLRTEDDQRFEVSPVLSLVFNAEEITALQEEYQDLLRETEKEGSRE